VDIFNFPDLTTDVLSGAFAFLLGRLGRALDSHHDGGNTDLSVESAAEVDPQRVLQGEWQPVDPDAQAVEAQLSQLRELAGALGSYERHPERVSTDDAALLEELSRLRTVLETVYGQHITFRGESRPATGTRVTQHLETVSGDVVGIEAGRVGSADVIQRAADVREGGSMIGVRADEVGR
jgi:hypothetical protein